MNFFRKKSAEVKIVDRHVVAVFRKGNPVLVWRCDLQKNNNFSLTLQGAEGAWELGLMAPSGVFHLITRFSDRADADEAFAALYKGLAKRKFAWLFTGLHILVLVAILVMALMAASWFAISGSASMLGAPPAPVAAAPVPNGVPVPADQVLQAPP